MTAEQFQVELRKLAENYAPAPDVLEQIGNVTLLIIVGPSGVGKTSVIKYLRLPYVPSDTTRKIRPGETEGVDYRFRTDYEQALDEIKSGRLVQIAVGAEGDLYSTKDTSYPDSGMATIAVMADVVPIFRKLGFAKTISAFITPPSYQEWMRRLGSHQLSDDKHQKRLVEGRRSFDFALRDDEVHFILNDDLDKAVSQTAGLLEGKVDKERERQGRQAAQAILNRL